MSFHYLPVVILQKKVKYNIYKELAVLTNIQMRKCDINYYKYAILMPCKSYNLLMLNINKKN